MCGRYALSLRPGRVRSRLAEQNMPVDEAPDDDDEQIRQTYNFAPGNHGLIYRAATGDRGGDEIEGQQDNDGEPAQKRAKTSHDTSQPVVDGRATRETKYKLQAAKWGLVPFWTKRPPDYGSQMRTINCRDDSLIENRGMWNTMKQRKRCVVMCEGFYEWLKKNGGKEKIPHFVKRKDGGLMCFAGLWDVVQYEGHEEKLYSYTIITTDSNKQLKFLHDRMPVILEPGSEEMARWLDPSHVGWSKELQSMLKPFEGELECYAVDKAVGKVGNNSPSFVVPIDSKENKNNIANFFGGQKAAAKSPAKKAEEASKETEVKKEGAGVKKEEDEDRVTYPRLEGMEDNAPVPKPKEESKKGLEKALKREGSELDDQALIDAADDAQMEDDIKQEVSDVKDDVLLEAADESLSQTPGKLEKPTPSPSRPPGKTEGGRKTRSATSNGTVAKTPTKEGNARITNFFTQ
ncbi:hypothetical protein MBLNU230_g4073t1 [Neophaeotheca triangularis]